MTRTWKHSGPFLDRSCRLSSMLDREYEGGTLDDTSSMVSEHCSWRMKVVWFHCVRNRHSCTVSKYANWFVSVGQQIQLCSHMTLHYFIMELGLLLAGALDPADGLKLLLNAVTRSSMQWNVHRAIAWLIVYVCLLCLSLMPTTRQSHLNSSGRVANLLLSKPCEAWKQNVKPTYRFDVLWC